ncbi:MAG: FeoC-like transcriptional regulator, partial [Candidatus Thorarchaeota archaeon]
QVMIQANVIRKPELARRVGVQPETLEDMLNMLLERGLLRLGNCEETGSDYCGGCPSSAGCHPSDSEQKSYYVTEKGKKYALA